MYWFCFYKFPGILITSDPVYTFLKYKNNPSIGLPGVGGILCFDLTFAFPSFLLQ